MATESTESTTQKLPTSSKKLTAVCPWVEATSLDEVFAQLGQEAEEESETLLPLDANQIGLDFGGESLGTGLLSASEGQGLILVYFSVQRKHFPCDTLRVFSFVERSQWVRSRQRLDTKQLTVQNGLG